MPNPARTRRTSALFAAAILAVPAASRAGDLVVTVTGIASPRGEIGIALFRAAEGFPLDHSGATSVWFPAKGSDLTHTFANLPSGRYAVAVLHDTNGNHKTDTNLVGMPQEPWGVSKNVRPALRAPKFEEAALVISGSAPTPVSIAIKR